MTADLETEAAMEPAGYRREHLGGADRAAVVLGAAMEPAGYRREHVQNAISSFSSSGSPQWSPPVIGGSTWKWETAAEYRAPWPQWSPPVIGGSTLAKAQRNLSRKQPQWSPPVIGGST